MHLFLTIIALVLVLVAMTVTQILWQLIRMLAKQKLTMLIVTHEMNFAREVADRVLYGIDSHRAYRLQLCCEELIYSYFDHSYPQQDEVDIKIAITYAQTNDNIEIELIGGGLAYDILAESANDESMTNLGADIIRNTAKLSSYAYQQRENIVKITL